MENNITKNKRADTHLLCYPPETNNTVNQPKFKKIKFYERKLMFTESFIENYPIY